MGDRLSHREATWQPDPQERVDRLLAYGETVKFLVTDSRQAVWGIVSNPVELNDSLSERIVFTASGDETSAVYQSRIERASVDDIDEREVSEIEIVALAVAAHRDSKGISPKPAIVEEIDRYAEHMVRRRQLEMSSLLGRLHDLEKPKRGKRK